MNDSKYQSKIDLNKAKEIIAALDKIDIKNESIEEILALLKELINGYVLNAIQKEYLSLYRGIKYIEKPKTLSDIVYPPLHLAKINRASYEKEQMFYATSSKRAVFYELKVKPNDKLIIAEWNINNPLLFSSVGYTETVFETLGSSKQIHPGLIAEQYGSSNQFIADYIYKLFCQDIPLEKSYLYKMTNAIAKLHLLEATNNMFSGLFYPTIQFQANEDNYAIKKETIDKGLLDFIRIEFIEVLDIQDKRYKYRILDVSDEIQNDRNIIWKNSDKQCTVYDDTDELVFVSENNTVVAYNEEGEIINPD